MRAEAGVGMVSAALAVACLSGCIVSDDSARATVVSAPTSTVAIDDASRISPTPTTTSPAGMSPASTLPAPEAAVADPSIAQVIVDGRGYDLCAGAAGDPAVTGLLGGTPDTQLPKSLDELARALGLETGPGLTEINEGAVSCVFTLEGETDVSTVVKAWTDDSLQFSLGEPGATAATRGALLRSAVWNGVDPTTAHVGVDLLGVGDGGWSGHYYNNYVAFAWSGPVMLSMSTMVAADTACSAEPATSAACHVERGAPTVEAFKDLFPRLVATFTSGAGAPTRFPDDRPVSVTATIGTPNGPKDVCGAAAKALPLVEPPDVGGVATVNDDYLGYVGDLDVGRGVQCVLTGNDRDFDRGVVVAAWGDDEPLAEEMYRSDVANVASTGRRLDGVGDEAFLEYNALYVLDGGTFLYIAMEASAVDTAETLRHLLKTYANAVLGEL